MTPAATSLITNGNHPDNVMDFIECLGISTPCSLTSATSDCGRMPAPTAAPGVAIMTSIARDDAHATVNVTWQASMIDGGDPYLNYTITVNQYAAGIDPSVDANSPPLRTTQSISTTTSTLVTGLLTNATYFINIRAANVMFSGNISTPQDEPPSK